MEAIVLCQHFNNHNKNSQHQLPHPLRPQLDPVDDSLPTQAAAFVVAFVVIAVVISCFCSSCLPKSQQRSATLASANTASVPSATSRNWISLSLTAVADIMGGCLSAASAPVSIIPQVDGGEDDYHKRYLEDQILGEGEFGVVKMVHDVTVKNSGSSSELQQTPYACKLLRKGAVFKDNTLYSPIKPEVLAAEIEILRVLQGKHYCLFMVAIYETRSVLYMVTEFCAGGEMMEYVAAQSEDLRTEDVSRISFQLLSAVDHCAKHGIIHRDIKPENCMFQDIAPGAALRLIDFGSGTIHASHKEVPEDGALHTTFAGSAFYISPEMFQRTYSSKTDVWSVGATLYVLVAGYPANDLQKAFNLLQKTKRDLRTLPNLPENMPDSFYELLDDMLTYRHKKRPAASNLLANEFVRFHGELEAKVQAGLDGEEDDDFQLSLEQISATAAGASDVADGSTRRTASVSIRGSVRSHNIFLGFKKYERSLTTLLATMLSKTELNQLLTILKERIASKILSTSMHGNSAHGSVSTSAHGGGSGALESSNDSKKTGTTTMDRLQEQKLHVVEIKELKMVLSREMKNDKMYVFLSNYLCCVCMCFRIMILTFVYCVVVVVCLSVSLVAHTAWRRWKSYPTRKSIIVLPITWPCSRIFRPLLVRVSGRAPPWDENVVTGRAVQNAGVLSSRAVVAS
jgi:calcium/calmodulin-dependent protein kinase I